ncbi:armadillo-type protein [Phlyctochytrium arcticum]|nr:armadillo-type protein [Phlyctochytrium arcticum]
MGEDQKKKRPRGKRGGKKVKDAAAAKQVSGQEPSVTEHVVVHDERTNVERRSEVEAADNKAPDAEGQKKKTRRGRRGKAPEVIAPAAPAVREVYQSSQASGANFIPLGSGPRETENTDYEPARLARENQAFYGDIDQEDLTYFMTMEKQLDAAEDPEQRQMIINAMYRELDGKELIAATDPNCSPIIEKLLISSDDFRLRVFMDRLNGEFSGLFRHQFASHVVQCLLEQVGPIIERELNGDIAQPPIADDDEDKENEEKADVGELPTMHDQILGMCEQGQGQWALWMGDNYASHLVRVVFGVLAGKKPEVAMRSNKSKKWKAGRQTQQQLQDTVQAEATANQATAATANTSGNGHNQDKPTQVPPAFGEALAAITEDILSKLSDSELRQYSLNPTANPVLQILLTSPSSRGPLLLRLLSIDSETAMLETDPFIEALIRSTIGSHLFEKILQAAPPHLFHQLYLTYFRSHLKELCEGPVSNFVVQQLLAQTRNGTQLRVVMDEILTFFKSLMKVSRAGLIVRICEACVKHRVCQKEVIKAITMALLPDHHDDSDATVGLYERRMLVQLILNFQTLNAYSDESKPNLHGSLILQKLLLFDAEPAKIVIDSFMSLPVERFLKWSQDPIGSHLVETLLLCPGLHQKAKRKIIRTFVGHYPTLACNKYGSHIVDKCWAVADITLKEVIAEDLNKQIKRLRDDHFGRFVVRNCRLDQFAKQREEWMERLSGIDRKKSMFDDILGDAAQPGLKGDNAIKGEDGKAVIKGNKPEVVDPLWTTHIFDSELSALGFGGANTLKKDKEDTDGDKKSKRKDKRKPKSAVAHDFENTEKMLIDSETIAPDAPSKESRDEIDSLFQKTKKRARGQDFKEVATPITPAASPQDQKAVPMDNDLEGVLDAISATKRKRGKKGAAAVEDVDEGEKEDGSKKKKKKKADDGTTKKKRKFES